MMILSVLGSALACEWGITKWEKAFLSTLVLLGWFVGSFIWGKLSDKYGRKFGMIASCFFTFYFGLLSSMVPNLISLYILRFLVGIGISGLTLSFTITSEFSPKNYRGKSSVFLMCFWTFGACFEIGLAVFIMPTLGWKWLLALTSIPAFISFFINYFFLDESARWQLSNGQTEKAINTLKKVSKTNNVHLPEGNLSDKKTEKSEGNFLILLSKEHRLHSVIQWILWFTVGFGFYGIVLLTTVMFQKGDACTGSKLGDLNECKSITKCLVTKDYIDIFYSSLAEFPGIIISFLLIDIIGRKLTIVFSLGIVSICIFLLNICLERWIILLLISCIRCNIYISFLSLYVYAPEYYPTAIRALGFGTCTAMARIGAIISPFIVQVLYETSPNLAINIYGSITTIATFLPFFLQETRNRELK